MPDQPLPDPPQGLPSWEPEEVLAFLRTASDDEVRDAVRQVGTPGVLAFALDGMAARFAPDPARRPGVLRFVLTDGGTEHVSRLHVDQEGARHEAGDGPCRATVRTDVARFLKIGAGAADPKRLLLTGRMSTRGDLVWLALVLRGLPR